MKENENGMKYQRRRRRGNEESENVKISKIKAYEALAATATSA